MEELDSGLSVLGINRSIKVNFFSCRRMLTKLLREIIHGDHATIIEIT